MANSQPGNSHHPKNSDANTVTLQIPRSTHQTKTQRPPTTHWFRDSVHQIEPRRPPRSTQNWFRDSQHGFPTGPASPRQLQLAEPVFPRRPAPAIIAPINQQRRRQRSAVAPPFPEDNSQTFSERMEGGSSPERRQSTRREGMMEHECDCLECLYGAAGLGYESWCAQHRRLQQQFGESSPHLPPAVLAGNRVLEKFGWIAVVLFVIVITLLVCLVLSFSGWFYMG